MIMNEKYRDLWEKIARFELDDPQASTTFSDKLSHEQRWTKAFTYQAISEYKRFMFLCVILPHGASPSKVVDEVWHMHLTYTKSYWIDFCRDTLGKDIHHIPSTGGKEQQAKHEDWYEDTLLQYVRYFGEEAPKHIWPRLSDPVLIVPKVSRRTILLLYAGALGIPLLISLAFYGKWNMFALSGPQFLGFYVYATVGAYLLHNWFRSKVTKLRKAFVAPRIPTYLNTYQIADFLQGRRAAIDTAIVNLVDWGKLMVYESSKYVVQGDPLSPSDEYKMNPARGLSYMGDEGYTVVHWKLQWDLKYSRRFSSELDSLSVLKLGIGAYVPVLCMAVLGIARIMQGIYNDRPVVYLMLQIGIFALIFFLIQYLRNLSFKDWLKDLVKAKYEQQWKSDYTLSQKFSLFGEQVLYGLPVAFLVAKQFMEAPYNSGSGSDGGSGSCGSDGGSSCGGGCGGCGGGD